MYYGLDDSLMHIGSSSRWKKYKGLKFTINLKKLWKIKGLYTPNSST